MDCTWTQQRLFDYLDGGLDTATRRTLEEHLEGCVECTGYAEALAQPDDGSEAWTQQLLQRTGNGACEQSREQLPRWIDHELEDVESTLVGGHVEHCAECTALTGVLRTMQEELPAFAEVEPDPEFLDDVLAATVTSELNPVMLALSKDLPALAEVEPDAAFLGEVLAATMPREQPLPWVARVDAWFAKMLQRPRIAWEGAYIATACLMLLFFFPGSPLASVPDKALGLARTDPDKLEQPFVALKTNINVGAQEAWYTTQVAARTIAVRAGAESGDAYRKAKRGIGTLWDRIASDPLTDETQEEATTNGVNP